MDAAAGRGLRHVRYSVEGDGLDLNVVRAGQEGAPCVVFVHGYPDTHRVWVPTMARLVQALDLVAYDVRGAGESDAPSSVEGYRIPHLVNDLIAVVDWVSPDAPVHLVGHDWGSAVCWDAVLRAGTDRQLRGRIASYTSISGPSRGHFAAWMNKSRHGDRRQRLDMARQLRRSWYMLWFQVPRLPEVGLRALLAGPPWVRGHYGLRDPAPTLVSDAINGLGIYRANLRDHEAERHPLQTDIPVQLIVPRRDPFLIPELYDDLPLWCSKLTRRDIDAGHWVQRSRADQVASWIEAFVSSAPPSAPTWRRSLPIADPD